MADIIKSPEALDDGVIAAVSPEIHCLLKRYFFAHENGNGSLRI